ncbi:MAG: GAF domain-containing protein [Bacteroidota bacterium]|nr:MAG: GAF domain-containing protein [Bacteroidota bacterium]
MIQMKSFFVVLVGSILNLLATMAQVIPSDAPFYHYTSKEGLSQQVVRAIIQDTEGFIWVGTEDGLNKFDGYEFKQFRSIRNDDQSLPDNFIQALAPANDGGVWVGTNSAGLAKYDASTNKFIRFQYQADNVNSISDNRIESIYEDTTGTVWVGTNGGGLCRLNPNTGQVNRYMYSGKPGTIASNTVLGILSDRQGALWIRTNENIQKFDPLTETFNTANATVFTPSTDIRNSFILDQNQDIWTSVGAVLLRYNTLTGQEELIPFSNFTAENLLLLDVASLNDNYLWVSSMGEGIFLFDKRNYSVVNFRHNPSNPASLAPGGILALIQDKTGSLWLGSNSIGISKLNINRKKFQHFKNDLSDPNSIRGNTIRALLVDSDYTIWVSVNSMLDRLTRDYVTGKYQRVNDNRFDFFNSNITVLFEDSKRNIWIASWGQGMVMLRGGSPEDVITFGTDNKDVTLSENIIQAIYEDRHGNFWIGTETSLDLYNPNTGMVRTFRHNPNNPNSLAPYGVQANTIVEDAFGNIWVGTWGGLTQMVPKDKEINSFDVDYTFIRYLNDPENENSISDNRIISLYYNRKINTNEIYAGTYGSGLNRIKFGEKGKETPLIKVYTRSEGLPNDVVYTMLSDPEGKIWLSTNHGLSCFDPATEKFINYDVNDGLQANQFFWGARAIGLNGELLFGGINGFNMFNSSEIVQDETKPEIVFTDLKVMNQSLQVGQKVNKNIILKKGINQTSKIVLTHRENVFSIEFSGLHYAFPENNRYRYMMEGFDEDWIEVDSKKRFASYTNLNHGKYTFKVDASNYDGIWTETPRELRIVIRPPFWKRWLFRIFVLIVIGLIAYEFYNRRRAMIEQDKRLLEGKINEGEKLIAEKVQEVELQKEQIRKRDIEEAEMRFANQGMAHFSEVLSSSEDDLHKLSKSIVSEMVGYVGGVMGVVYLFQENSEDGILELYASYAADAETLSKTHIHIGEGYVGTSFLEGKTISIDHVPETYARLGSGLGSVSPSHIYLVPIMQRDNKQGILEIATLKALEPYKVKFMEKISENMTSIITVRKAGEKLNYLLEQSHQQTEELRSQEEEMRQNMEEMLATQEETSRREEDWKREREKMLQREAELVEENKKLKQMIDEKEST